MDDRKPLSPGFVLDDGVELVALRSSDSLCLVYDAMGRAGRKLVVKEYFPAGLARRDGETEILPLGEGQREIFEAGRQSFIAFCERLAAIEHRSVEALVGLIEGYGSAYLVLDEPAGVDLATWLDQLGRPIADSELRSIADGLCEGLAVAHAADLLHLDLAPDSIYVHANAQPVIVGFAATALSFAASAGRPPLPPKSGYAPVERETSDLLQMGPRTDIYALAAVLFRMVVGEEPPGARMRRSADPVSAKLASLRTSTPPNLSAAIAAGMAMDRGQRPATAAAFHALLRAPDVSHAKSAADDPPRHSPAQSERQGSAEHPRLTAESAIEERLRLAGDEPPPEYISRIERAPVPRRSLPENQLLLAAAAVVFALAGVLAYNVIDPFGGTEDQPIAAVPPAPVQRPVPPPSSTPARPEPIVTAPPRSEPSPAPPAKSVAVAVPDKPAPGPAVKRASGDRFRDCPDCPEVVVVPAGKFRMGSTPSDRGHEPDEAPQHTVEIRVPFAMSRTPVTKAEFELFAAQSGYRAAESCRVFESGKWLERRDLSFRNPGFRQDGDHPVVCVNWDDARSYADWLSRRTGKSYRLPSEAEWEYAARAGTTTPFWWGSEISTAQANYDGSVTFGGGRPGENRQGTVRALEFEPNPFGLYQVHGNVSQWTADCWNDGYHGAPVDGSAWRDGDCQRRVLRGGSWGYAPKDLRAAYREGATASNRNFNFGIRLVRELEDSR